MNFHLKCFVVLIISIFILSCSNKDEKKCLTENEITNIVDKICSNFKIELPKASEASSSDLGLLKVFITEDNKYFIENLNTIEINENYLESEILKNIGKDSTVELLGDKNSKLEYTFYVLDIIKKHGLKVLIKTNI